VSVKGGFTTVELLVTLFIAAMMVMSGYQLYTAVNQRSGRVRAAAEASNLAYSRLRQNSDYVAVTNNCVAQAETGASSSTVTGTTLPGDVTVIIRRCKPFADSDITRVTALVRYDTPVKEVAHAVYVAP
jgi:Tfp pilus assembly protein PilE